MLRVIEFVVIIFILQFQIKCDALEVPNAFYNKHNSKLPKLICDGVRDAFSKDRQISTVSMAIFKNNIESPLIDETLKCLPKRLSVNIKDFRSEQHELEFNDRSASIVIMIADEIDKLKFKKIMSDQQSSSVLNHMAKFFIVTSNRNSQVGRISSTFFPQVGIINFGLLYEKDMEASVEVSNHFINSTTVLSGTSLETSGKNPWKGISSKLFPDKLKNLNGYTYNVAYHHRMSYAHYIVQTDKFISKNLYFFESIAKLQNASIKLTLIKTTDQHTIQETLDSLISDEKMDATISESGFSSQNTSKILTYDENAVCVMVPNSLKVEVFGIKLIDFSKNNGRKLLIVLIVMSFLVVWRLYKNHGAVDSLHRVIFICFSHLTGQTVRINKNNRRILVIMLQTALLMIIFVKNFFECHLTSVAIDGRYDAKFESIEEILQYRKIILAVDASVEDILKKFAEYQEQLEKGYVIINRRYGEAIEKIDEYTAGKITLVKCDYLDHYIRASKTKAHYMLPQRFYVRFLKLDVPVLSPFTQRLQDIMNHAFDSGLTQKWETMYLTELFGSKNGNLKLYEESDEHGQFITLEELKKPFKIILVLYITAISVFLCEIFWHGFLKRLSWTLVLRVFRCQQRKWESMGRIRRMLHFWRQRRALNVRRIQVQPINV